MKILKLIGSKISSALYSLPRILFINFYRAFLRIKFSNSKKIPPNHSVIFAFNHTTGADPIIALGALKRKIYFVADSQRFTNRLTNFFMRRFANSIPVFQEDAQKNVKSFKELFSISKRKKIFFGIFPEGDLFKKGKFGKFKDGAAYLSFKTKIPIVPVYLHNVSTGPAQEGWFGRHPVFEGIASLFMNTYRRIHVFIGDPIDPMAENIMEELKELTDKNEYKLIIDAITKELEKGFLELKQEAEIFSISKKAGQLNRSARIHRPARIQNPAVMQKHSLEQKAVLDFDEDEGLIMNPADAQ